LVDITRCERCGKTIPALDTGCPWCEAAEARRPGFREDDWLPLSIRMLFWLFMANLVVTGLLAILTLVANVGAGPSRSIVAVLASLRLLLSGATLVGLVFREPWGRWLPLSFLAFEGLSWAGVVSFMPESIWVGGWLAPLWNLLFVFLFLRDDVRARLDRGMADRKAVGELLELFREEESRRPRR
jgi:hypothetical protein